MEQPQLVTRSAGVDPTGEPFSLLIKYLYLISVEVGELRREQSGETGDINHNIVGLIKTGFLPINSQPDFNGAAPTCEKIGWDGPYG